MRTRRQLLVECAAAGGAAALFAALDAYGVETGSRAAAPPDLRGAGAGRSVLILGAGLAGLTAAYELRLRGYECRVLEARPVAGGRCQTARAGTRVEELGKPAQVCDFAPDQYFNLGPWRIPAHHQSVLYYCRRLGVPLEIMVSSNDSGYLYYENAGGPLASRRLRRREVMADMRGYAAELLAKFADTGGLDQAVSAAERSQLIDFLINEGHLDAGSRSYRGTHERGYEVLPGAGTIAGTASAPLARAELLESGLWRAFRAVQPFERPYTMFQAVGGMDRIPQALQAALGDIITFNAELLELRQDERGVRASFKDLKTGMQAQASADYCVCTVPPGVLSRIPADFDAACQAALRAPTAMPVGKIGLQMNRRFWEEDDDIFGGASQTDIAGHTQIAYPSYGWLGQRGVVQGYYNFMSDAIRISGMDHAARSEFALAQGEKVHPGQFRRHFDGQAISIAWHLVQYSFGGWEQWSEAARREHYGKLLEPQGRVVFAGTHLSHLAGWQAGAVESAWQQIGKLHALAQSGRSA